MRYAGAIVDDIYSEYI